ncbi:MAG: C-5 cytosine-specific DNA methylase [Bacteriophage sp.]|nr:MAG: C-5 cytosine-specific DNA methylase [Bacteriophage sp.]
MEKNKFTHGSLFSGIGGPEIAAEEMGWKNMFHCEINPFGRKILDYWFPNSKSYEDITKTNFTEWRGKINVLTGGFPCQPFSCAGQRKGAEDDRYLWPEMLRAIREIQPDWVVGENVAGILSMVQPGSETALGREESLFGEVDRKRILHRQEYVVETVCNDLEREGYFVQPVVIPACAVGAPHRRDRVFFIAHRADAGVKGMQRKWEDNILSGRTASDTTCRGSGGTPHESCCENERQNGYETQQPFVRGCVRASSHSDGERCNNRSDNWKDDQFVTTRNGTPRRINQNGQNGSVGLARMVRLLPTPNAREADKYSKKYNPNSQMGTALTAMAVNGMLPTPAARDYQPSVSPQALKRKNGKMRTDALCNLPVMLGEHHSQNGGKTSQLNPLFVAEMMGFPPDWTVLPFQSGGRNR